MLANQTCVFVYSSESKENVAQNNFSFRIMKDAKLLDNKVIESLIFGSLSSAITTVLFQPLELIKTRIQLRDSNDFNRIFGKSTQSAAKLLQVHGYTYLWRGTGATLARSVPGVGLYYATLNVLQSEFSNQNSRPNNPTQALYFGLTARSVVSLALSPITVIKVRYESGRYRYTSLSSAIKDAYLRNGWVGIPPTILRDSIFSGIYYMCYTKLKHKYSDMSTGNSFHFSNFTFGIVSGLIASLVTNPLDVLKTLMQVDSVTNKSAREIVATILKSSPHGYMRFFDGLGPRCLRRTLVAATTWTFYEYFISKRSRQND